MNDTWQLSETWRAVLWALWSGVAFLQLVYYMSGWREQRRQIREAEEQAERAELQRRMVLPQVPSAPATGSLIRRLPKAPAGPAPGAVCDAYALGCQCWQCVARAERDRRMFCEEYDDPGLMDTLTGRPIEVLPVAEWPCDPGCVLRHAHRVG